MEPSTRVGKYRYLETEGDFICIKEKQTTLCIPGQFPECETCDFF